LVLGSIENAAANGKRLRLSGAPLVMAGQAPAGRNRL
jgi:hypothetical protein